MVYTNLNKKKWLFKAKRTRKHHILVMSALLISFLMVDVIGNLGFNSNFGNPENEFTNYLKTNELDSDNTFTGIGAPWNVTHYANTTLQNLDVSFYNNSFDASHEINLDTGWMGYQLNSTITDLYATRNLINGTFHCGTYAGGSPSPTYDDSAYVANWTFYEDDKATGNNPMSGNYYDNTHADSGGADCLELRIFGTTPAGNYDNGDICMWNATFPVPQGEITDARLYLAVNPKYTGESSGYFTLRVRINNRVLLARNLYAMDEHNGGAFWNVEKEDINNLGLYFPEAAEDVKISVEFAETGAEIAGDSSTDSYGVLIDNVTLVVKTKTNPTDIVLKLNGEQIKDGALDGEGSLGIKGSWNGTVLSSVLANFSSDYAWPFVFIDEEDLTKYKIEFNTNLALKANKTTPESYYLVDPDLDYQGSAFSVSNDSDVSWTTYAHMEIPSGYEETNLTVEYPSDYNLNGVYFSQVLDNEISQTTITERGDKKIVNIPVNSITSNTNGFWKLTAESPNYCIDMNLTNDATGHWEISNEYRSGEYLNVTAKINNTSLVSDYIQQTKAKLQIRFPNGTIWTEQTQLKLVDNTGRVDFDPILIPDVEPNYEVGEYEAIVTWNNTYSTFGFNETGIIFKTFTVIHDSYLEADDDYFENVFEGDTIILRVTFSDANDDSAIRNANVSTTNFMDEVKQFSETSPGYYILEFNTSGGISGINYLDITAEHPLYEDNQIQITIELIFETELTAEEYPSVKTAWNTNFTIHLNYTYFTNGTGIKNADTTVDWNGEWSETASNGLYNMTFNNSRCEVNKIYNLKLTFDKIGCESQIMIISVEVVSRETSIDSILINDRDCTANKSYNVRSGELLDFKVTYNDLEAFGAFISDAVVTLNKSTIIGEIFEENPTYYNYTLNSTSLGLGTSFVNIIAKKANYTSITVLLTINVFERNTEYNIYLDGVDYTANPQISMYTNQLLTINVTYIDSISTNFISGAILDINGSGISEVLLESYQNYSVTINTSDLNEGVNFLTIYVRKDGYEPQSILLTIQIIQIETETILYLNGIDKTSSPALTMYPNQLLSINVTYKESISQLFISEATVDINGSGISEVLGESSGNYSITIDTDDLNFGPNFLTIYVRKNGYEPKSIPLTIQIIQIETELILYLNGYDNTSNPVISLYTNQSLSIDVTYKESISQVFISEATVDISGSEILEVLGESSGNYSIILNSTELKVGDNFLTIYARRDGYEPKSIPLTVHVNLRATKMEVFVDDEDLSVPIGTLLNITIKYTDIISNSFIQDATVSLLGTDLNLSLGIDLEHEQYYVEIDTELELGFGVKFLTVFAQKDNYEPLSSFIRLDVQRIQGEVYEERFIDSTERIINIRPGESVSLRMVVRDPIFDEEIIDAYVTYTSAIGQGELLDSNDDGIYTGSIQNIIEGTHTITITIYAGDNYDFERYQFVISAVRPPEEVLLFQILTIVGVGAAIGVSGYLIAYQKVLKYPKQVRKIRAARSKVKKETPLDLEISSRDELIQQRYSEQIEPLEKQVKRKLGPKLSDAKLSTGEQEGTNNLDSNTSEK